MILFFVKNIYMYSDLNNERTSYSGIPQQLAAALSYYTNMREKTSSKICYRRELCFLRTRINLTNSLSNRLVSGGHFYYSYKMCREYYVNTLRSNFLPGTPRYLNHYIFKQKIDRDFLISYRNTYTMADLDYVLV
jgi:hypothetical protein